MDPAGNPIQAQYAILSGPLEGVKHTAIYMEGETFLDFTVMALNSVDLDSRIKSDLQQLEKEELKWSAIDIQSLCIVRVEIDNRPDVWYRGIITRKIIMANRVDVYLFDVGATRNVEDSAIFVLPDALKMYKPMAIKMSCLNIKKGVDNEGTLREFFKLFVYEKHMKIRITHEATNLKLPHFYAGYLDVFFCEEWRNLDEFLGSGCKESATMQGISLAERKYELKMLTSVVQQIHESVLPTYNDNSTTTINAYVSHAQSLSEFYLITKSLMSTKENIEQMLKHQDVEAVSSIEELSSSPIFFLKDESQALVRVKVLEISSNSTSDEVVVFKVDSGERLTVPLNHLQRTLTAPMKCLTVPGCVYKCSLRNDGILLSTLNELCQTKQLMAVKIQRSRTGLTHAVQFM